jgi:hypothetical protein
LRAAFKSCACAKPVAYTNIPRIRVRNNFFMLGVNL